MVSSGHFEGVPQRSHSINSFGLQLIESTTTVLPAWSIASQSRVRFLSFGIRIKLVQGQVNTMSTRYYSSSCNIEAVPDSNRTLDQLNI